MAIAALTLGFVGLYVWMLPPFGYLTSTTGIFLAIVVFIKKKPSRIKALIGLLLCLSGLTLSIILAIEMAAPRALGAEHTGILLNLSNIIAEEAVDSFLRLIMSPLNIPYLK